MKEWVWFDSELESGYQLGLEVTKRIYQDQTSLQKLEIYDTATFGRVMALDGVIQITEHDEFMYSEMLAHVPIFAHGAASEVIIIGGGDGAVLEEVLKHQSVQRVTLVEIDPHVVQLCRKYLPSISGNAFDDPRTELVFADGASFVGETDRRADVLIVDSTDPIGPGTSLFSTAFYSGCHSCIKSDGILVTQSGVPFVQREELHQSCQRLRDVFEDVGCYLTTVPTYCCGPMALVWASNDPAKRIAPLHTLTERFEAANIKTGYYTPQVHTAAFSLPTYIEKLIV